MNLAELNIYAIGPKSNTEKSSTLVWPSASECTHRDLIFQHLNQHNQQAHVQWLL